MRIAVYSLTRDRLEYTQMAFASLRERAGVPFDHFVVDNGSEDGTQDWLGNVYRPHWYKLLPENVGIGKGANLALDAMDIPKYNLIIKFDNDCRVVSSDILAKLSAVFEATGNADWAFALSPRVSGINRQPRRGRYVIRADRVIGITGHIGGLFLAVPARVYQIYRFPVDLPKARGYDSNLCAFMKQGGAQIGYVESLVVEHIDGTDAQARKYPAYFERKREEEKA